MYTFDYTTQSLNLNGVTQRLTTKENELLFMLCKHKNALLVPSHALRNIWGDANYFNEERDGRDIAKLRKHLKGDDRLEILNVHGKGFKLVAPTG